MLRLIVFFGDTVAIGYTKSTLGYTLAMYTMFNIL